MAKFIKIHNTYQGSMYESYVNTDKINLIFIEDGYTRLNVDGFIYALYSDQTPQEILQMIDEQPTVDAEPVRHGRWIRDEFGTRCGACGLYAYRDKFDQPWESPYCPHCGARMDEE